MANYIKPFGDYSQHEIINLFAFDGASADAGRVVKVKNGAGFENTDQIGIYSRGLGEGYANTLSPRWHNKALVTYPTSGETPLGILLNEVSEVDENGLPFKKNHMNKAFAKGMIPSGQTVPILKRGRVLISSGLVVGNPTAGQTIYLHANGGITNSTDGLVVVGQFLGEYDENGDILCQISL
jgi:hypothetical protein